MPLPLASRVGFSPAINTWKHDVISVNYFLATAASPMSPPLKSTAQTALSPYALDEPKKPALSTGDCKAISKPKALFQVSVIDQLKAYHPKRGQQDDSTQL